jgi:hypothetical protein
MLFMALPYPAPMTVSCETRSSHYLIRMIKTGKLAKGKIKLVY